jgi:hypothetical protein
MSDEKEESTLRLTPYYLTKNKLIPGDVVVLTADNGEPVILMVDKARKNESNIPGSGAFVSRNSIRRLFSLHRKHVITLGCDPEFLIVNKYSGKIIPAEYILPRYGEIGSDGPLGEFRPKPGKNEVELVNNLKVLVNELHRAKEVLFSERNLIAEAHSCKNNQAIGFHIHMGVPKVILKFATPGSKEFIRSFITCLDYFVGIPAMLLEDDNTRRLGNGQYGKPGDYRVSENTIEYRTPGGFHLRHPDYASGITALAGCIAEEIFRDIEEASDQWRNLLKVIKDGFIKQNYNLPDEWVIKASLQDRGKSLGIVCLPKIIDSLSKMKSFDKYGKSIKTYFNLLLKAEQYYHNLKDNW